VFLELTNEGGEKALFRIDSINSVYKLGADTDNPEERTVICIGDESILVMETYESITQLFLTSGNGIYRSGE
jgi:hypothetical protein